MLRKRHEIGLSSGQNTEYGGLRYACTARMPKDHLHDTALDVQGPQPCSWWTVPGPHGSATTTALISSLFFFFFWSVSVMRIAQRALFHAAGEETPTAVPLPHGSAKHALSRQPKHSAFNTKYSQSLI